MTRWLRRAAAWPLVVGLAWSLLVGRLTGLDARAALALGLVLGAAAEMLLRLHGRRSARRALGVVVVLHGLLLAWALADTPALYADAFYARGGILRAAQLVATDVLGPDGVLVVGLALAIAFARPWRLVAAGLALLAACHVPSAALPEKPGIVVVTVDGLDRIEARVTPHLAALAASSTRFDRTARTSPSWAANAAARLVFAGYRVARAAPEPSLRSLVHEALGHPGIPGPRSGAWLDRGAFFLEASFSTTVPVRAPYYRRFTDAAYRGRFKYAPAAAGQEPLDDDDRAQLRGLHEAALASVDDAIEELRAGLDPATIVVVVGRTTFLVHDPRHGPQRAGQLVRDADLAPTLIELAGVPAADAAIGGARSLVPALRGERLAPIVTFEEGPGSLSLRSRTVRDDDWTLLYEPTRTGVQYRLLAAADERKDVAAEHPAEVARLREELWRWMLAEPGVAARDGYLVARPPLPADVLWIVVDALPADEGLANGTRFERAYTAATTPGPSLRAMLAGARAPAGEGPVELLRSAGMVTRAFLDDVDPGPGFDAVRPSREAAAFLAGPKDGRFFAFVQVARAEDARALASLADDRTIVVVTAARGATSGDDREATAHVPLAIAGPGFAADAIVGAPCRTIDILPTVLDVLGLESTTTEGRSLLGAGAAAERIVLVEGSRGGHALVHGHWHLVVRDGTTVLHDLAGAPDVDVARLHPDVVAELRARMSAAIAGVSAADARGEATRPPVIRLRFVGGAEPHRITGTIHARIATAEPVALGPEALRQEGPRIDVAFRTDPRTAVGIDLVADEATWEFWLDDAPLRDVFGGPDALRAPALTHGITSFAARAAAGSFPARGGGEKARLPPIDAGRERGLFVVR